jgi:tRNA 2-thiouridine synthesizing protein D
MLYSLLITAAPEEPAALTALHTAQAVLERGHELYRVFFYRDGVRLACVDPVRDSAGSWQEFVRERNLDATVCSGASARRGLFEQNTDNLALGFELAGLGQLVDALAASDRILCFGG